jgi:hypothetical protein
MATQLEHADIPKFERNSNCKYRLTRGGLLQLIFYWEPKNQKEF